MGWDDDMTLQEFYQWCLDLGMVWVLLIKWILP